VLAAFDKLIFDLEEIDTIRALVTVRKHSFSREATGLSPRQIERGKKAIS
jgi:hypothetical protein